MNDKNTKIVTLLYFAGSFMLMLGVLGFILLCQRNLLQADESKLVRVIISGV